MAVVGTALGGALIKLGRWGDERGLGPVDVVTGPKDYVVKFRTSGEEEFKVLGANPYDAKSGYKTREEALAAAQVMTASNSNVEAKVFHAYTGAEIKF
jgi:hypothetical protein